MEPSLSEMEISTTPLAIVGPDEQHNSDTQPNKRRRKKSIVWEHFTVENVGPGVTKACCNGCKKSFAYITGPKLAGTSHLKRHIALRICPVYRQKNQSNPDRSDLGTDGHKNASGPPKRRYRTSPKFLSVHLNQEHCNHEIAKMVIEHDYPLHIVEHPGFIDFVHTLQPQFNMASFSVVQGDCVAIYLREKNWLMKTISAIPWRINLSIDLWTSNLDLGYVLITGFFIGGDWNLHRRILNVVTVPYLDSDDALNHAVMACISEWHLNGKLFSLTLNSSSNEIAIKKLRGLLSIKNPLIFNGQLVKANCFAQVLSSLAQDALGAVSGIVKKIRDSVKYVKTSDAREDKFIEIKQQLQVPSIKNLCVDDITKWNTTYHMLVAAAELKEVFYCLDTSDPEYNMAPSMEEWKEVESLCTQLKGFYDAADILTSKMYPTANVFFHEVWKIQWELMHAAESEDPFLSNLAKPLLQKFDKYWRDCCISLAIAIVMDPRYKIKLVEFSFNKVFGEDAESWIRTVDDGIHELSVEYSELPLPLPETYAQGSDGMSTAGMSQEAPHSNDGLSDFELYIHEISGGQAMKSELDQYLEEPLLPRAGEFDILSWWKMNQSRYPVLSRMAADILSVPISTATAHSVFNTDGKKFDSYHSSLQSLTLQALVCFRDWLQYGSSETSNAVVKVDF